MDDKLTFQQMWDLVKTSLYTFCNTTGLATPNYCYCRKDAPVYRWQNDLEFPFVKVEVQEMYATLRDNQLITPGHDGAQFVVDVDGPGVYEVKTCQERDGVVEFGTGLVEVTNSSLSIWDDWQLPITDHTPVILTPARM